MAEEKQKTKKPKRRPCAQTRKNLKRAEWYYRDGEYFTNKRSFQDWKKKKLEAKKKAEEEAAQKATV